MYLSLHNHEAVKCCHLLFRDGEKKKMQEHDTKETEDRSAVLKPFV